MMHTDIAQNRRDAFVQVAFKALDDARNKRGHNVDDTKMRLRRQFGIRRTVIDAVWTLVEEGRMGVTLGEKDVIMLAADIVKARVGAEILEVTRAHIGTEDFTIDQSSRETTPDSDNRLNI